MKERRLSPRYTYTEMVGLLSLKGERFDARSCDISITGIGLLLTRATVVALAQSGSMLTTGDRFRLVLPGTLNASAQGGLTLNCRARHVRRLSREEYQVGVWFLDPTPGQKAGLVALLEANKPPFSHL